jgi:hypothetical protein
MANSSGYDIRHSLLEKAKDMLFDEWHAKRETEAASATFENRGQVHVPAPTVEEVKKMAESLYEFVCKK